MKNQILKLIVLISARLLASALAGASFLTTASAGDAVVAAAANFKDALDQLEADFESRTGHKLNVTTGSTGKLYAQIINGAPFDVFLAADQERPRLLEESRYAVEGSRFTYAVGRLVLWSPNRALITGDGAAILRDGRFRRLAIANPDLAPYGAAAKDVLEALSLWEALQPKIVRGENISQSFTYAATGNTELGFVALSSIIGLEIHSGSYWEPPPHLYTPIRQDAVLLKRAADNDAARAFTDYLKSEDARAIIAGLGYGVE